jgi:hypothetical protein
MYQTVEVKQHPELKRLLQAADPSYKKHKVSVHVCKSVSMHDTYWSGGTRYTCTAVRLDNCKAVTGPQFNPPNFGGPSPTVEIPVGVAIVKTGIFCGKTAQASIILNPEDATKALPNL